jgi:hypothetical protein
VRYDVKIFLIALISIYANIGAADKIGEFEVLFSGQEDISNHWIGNIKGYKVIDGAMVTQNKAGNIYTKKEYQDYVFRFDFKLPPGGNNGLGLRAPHPDDKTIKTRDVAYNNFELQILDDSSPKYANLKAWQFHGSAYGISAASKGALKPVGEWNTEEIYFKGNHLKVTVNGKVILDIDVSMKKPESKHAAKLAKGRNRAAGHVCFAGHGAGIAFKNVSIAVVEDDYTMPTTNDNEAPEGFTALFNGKDLTNWKGLLLKPNDKPHKRASLSAEKLAPLQAKADEVMKAHWTITDKGELFFDGKKGGFSLATAKKYGNFEFHASWKIEANADSGIYLRGLPQVQIWDPTDKKAHKHGADKGSGGLWNNKVSGRWPLVMADKPAGEWNHFYIRMVDDSVSIWLNGKLIVNDAALENLWQKGTAIPTEEQIELQCHGDPIWFKNIYIKELSK